MIKFINISKEPPYKIFKSKYDDALNANQPIIEAICISSYSSSNKEVNARFVNLKFVNERDFIFLLIIIHQNLKTLSHMTKLPDFFIGAKLTFK